MFVAAVWYIIVIRTVRIHVIVVCLCFLGSRRSSAAMSVGVIEGRKLAMASMSPRANHSRHYSEKPPKFDIDVGEGEFEEEAVTSPIASLKARSRSSSRASAFGRSIMRRLSIGRRTNAESDAVEAHQREKSSREMNSKQVPYACAFAAVFHFNFLT